MHCERKNKNAELQQSPNNSILNEAFLLLISKIFLGDKNMTKVENSSYYAIFSDDILLFLLTP